MEALVVRVDAMGEGDGWCAVAWGASAMGWVAREGRGG